jgi:hypothetical protein
LISATSGTKHLGIDMPVNFRPILFRRFNRSGSVWVSGSGWFDDVTADKLISAGIVKLEELASKIAVGMLLVQRPARQWSNQSKASQKSFWNAGWQSGLRHLHTNGGTGVWDHQVSDGFQAVLLEQLAQSHWHMESSLSGLECQAHGSAWQCYV